MLTAAPFTRAKKVEAAQNSINRWKDKQNVVYLYYTTILVSACSVMSDSLWPPDCSPPGSSVHGISQTGKTGVGCYFLLQCMKVKSESEVTQSCPTLHDPMDCSLPGSSVHGIFQARVLEWGAIAFSARDPSQYNKEKEELLRSERNK